VFGIRVSLKSEIFVKSRFDALCFFPDLWWKFCDLTLTLKLFQDRQMDHCMVEVWTVVLFCALQVDCKMLMLQHTPVVTLDDFNVNIDS